MRASAASAIITCLEREGVQHAFGISGSHFLAFLHALKDSSIQYISVKHESAAGFMALNYAKIAQKPALVVATAGPGAANLINGIAELYKCCIPAFILTPLVSTTTFGKNAFQEDTGLGGSHSVCGLMKQVTRKAVIAHRAEVIPEYIRMLLRESLTPPYGPVYLGIPSDLFAQEIELDELDPVAYRLTDDQRIEPGKIERLAREIQGAQNPLLLVGNRCVYPRASEALMRLIDSASIPYVVTHAAKGLLDERHALFGGVLDLFGHRSAEQCVKHSDCVVSFGLDFGESETMKYDRELFANARLISCDNHAGMLGINFPTAFSIAGSIPATCLYLEQRLREAGHTAVHDTQQFARMTAETNAAQIKDMESTTQPLTIMRVLKHVSDTIDRANTIVLGDIGASSFSAIRHFVSSEGAYFSSPLGCSMGQSVAGCIGAKVAASGKNVLCICGDGAFAMQGNEALTAVQYKIGVTWLVFVDCLLNMIEINQCLSYGGNLGYCTEVQTPDFAKLAEAYGVSHRHVETLEQLSDALSAAAVENQHGHSAIITIAYEHREHLPVKPQAVSMLKDYGQTKDLKSNPSLMRAFKKVLREKV